MFYGKTLDQRMRVKWERGWYRIEPTLEVEKHSENISWHAQRNVSFIKKFIWVCFCKLNYPYYLTIITQCTKYEIFLEVQSWNLHKFLNAQILSDKATNNDFKTLISSKLISKLIIFNIIITTSKSSSECAFANLITHYHYYPVYKVRNFFGGTKLKFI